MIKLPTKKRASYFVVAIFTVAVAHFVESTAALEGSSSRDGSSTREQLPSSGRARQAHTADSANQGAHRLREGTIITDQGGLFREDGDGATFVGDSGWEFGALPNLNLERVVRLLKSVEEPSSIRWSVSGKVTEFSGRNFLLIHRAVYKSTTAPPVPDRVAK